MSINTISASHISEDAIRTIRIELEDLWEKFIRRSATEQDINKHILISIVRIVSSIFNMQKPDVEHHNILKRLYRKGGEPIFFAFKQDLHKNMTIKDLEKIGKLILPNLIKLIGNKFDEHLENQKIRFLQMFPNFQAEHLKQQVVPDLPEMFDKATEDIFSTHLPFELEQIIDRRKILKNFQYTKQYLMMMFYEYKKALLYLMTPMNWMVSALNIKKTAMFNW